MSSILLKTPGQSPLVISTMHRNLLSVEPMHDSVAWLPSLHSLLSMVLHCELLQQQACVLGSSLAAARDHQARPQLMAICMRLQHPALESMSTFDLHQSEMSFGVEQMQWSLPLPLPPALSLCVCVCVCVCVYCAHRTRLVRSTRSWERRMMPVRAPGAMSWSSW